MSLQVLNAHLNWINDPQTGLIHLESLLRDARRDCELRHRITESELQQIEDVIAAKAKRLTAEKEAEFVAIKPKQKSLF